MVKQKIKTTAMKKTTTAILVMIALVYASSCTNGNSTAQFKASPPDTATVMAFYALGNTGQARIDQVFRVSKDTTVMEVVDSSGGKITQRKVTRRDTTYWVPLADTLKKDGAPVLDSVGKLQIKINYAPLPPLYIYQDYNKPLKPGQPK
jgi:hypothetical protein